MKRVGGAVILVVTLAFSKAMCMPSTTILHTRRTQVAILAHRAQDQGRVGSVDPSGIVVILCIMMQRIALI